MCTEGAGTPAAQASRANAEHAAAAGDGGHRTARDSVCGEWPPRCSLPAARAVRAQGAAPRAAGTGTGSAQAVHRQCACSAHAVRMQCAHAVHITHAAHMQRSTHAGYPCMPPPAYPRLHTPACCRRSLSSPRAPRPPRALRTLRTWATPLRSPRPTARCSAPSSTDPPPSSPACSKCRLRGGAAACHPGQ